jgi:LysR family nod box-dependent transcriptional activator
MRFDRLDLNLLVALDALIEERSVSGTARRLHLSQPAVTGALNRLRDFFGDALLIQSGRRMLLTPKAEELAGPVRRTLIQIRSEITRPIGFEPVTAERHFTIVASDYASSIMLAGAIADAAALAPRITFEVVQPDRFATERLERADVDLLITVTQFTVPDHPILPLFDDREVVISCAKAGYTCVDEKTFFSAGHAITMFGKDRHPSVIDDFLSNYRHRRRIEVCVPSFTALPQAVIGTRRLATMHGRLAEQFAAFYPIVIHAPPIPLPRIEEVAQWHRLREKDAGVQWLVQLLAKHSSALPAFTDRLLERSDLP